MALDLDAVLITGAGASCSFGTPLMGGWCEALVRSLSRSPGYREATRLAINMAPEDFERTLGEFLHQVRAWDEIESLIPLTVGMNPGQQNGAALNAQDVLPGWHRATKFQLAQIVARIQESLYDMFAGSSIDLDAARTSYDRFLTRLGLTPASRLVYTTTNYDTIGETVLDRLGFRPDWGQLAAVDSYNDQRLDVTNLVDGVPRSTPVLHLHGRVGWYRRPTGEAYASYIKQHNTNYGTPIVMLPNLNKAYTDDRIISDLWVEFGTALARARRVFVLGHSLHDAPLIQAIRDNVESPRVLVSVYSHQPDQRVVDLARKHGWRAVAMDFKDGSFTAPQTVDAWLNETKET